MTITFVVGYQGLSTSIDAICTSEEELAPNMSSQRVIVADAEAMEQWIAAKNEQLAAWWTPNQQEEEKQENGIVAIEAQKTMDRLEREAMNLTPSQFTIARSLATSYGHLWSGVPDGTYNTDDIRLWSLAHQSEMFPGGIYAPFIMENGDVGHVTGSGRLAWEISKYGNVRLEIFRPGTVISKSEDESILVAAVEILNGPNDGDTQSFEFGEFNIGFSDKAKTYEQVEGYAFPQVKTGVIPFEKDELYDTFLHVRHVHALVRPLVALLTLNTPPPEHELDDETYETISADDWKVQRAIWDEETNVYLATVIYPAIDKAKTLLQPLYDIALPDPFYTTYGPCSPQEIKNLIDDIVVQYGKKKPETFYGIEESLSDEYTRKWYIVYHRSESFPVETERAAIHAVLLLTNNPELSLVEAVKRAIVSLSYRP